MLRHALDIVANTLARRFRSVVPYGVIMIPTIAALVLAFRAIEG